MALRMSILLVVLLSAVAATAVKALSAERPNILLVMLDDVGFMDFSAYGSDTSTPTIDSLARSGVQFTRYYTYPLCGPSRASFMTGQDNHRVGAGTLAEALTDEMRELPAYSMEWRADQQTIASRLQGAGYQTFVSGKWGIGAIGANLPDRFGFDQSWVLDATGSSNYGAKPYVPIYKEVSWFEDGERTSLPDDFYSSRDIVDRMIEYVDDVDSSKPFFGYLSFQAVHIPVQVPKEFVDRYDGVFDEGWEDLRRERLQRAIELGLVPEGSKLGDRPYNARDWDSLDNDDRRYWSRVMQVNAGMMEAADFHLGRLLDHLKVSGRLGDTVVIVASDNGPEYNTLGKTSAPAVRAVERIWMAIEGWDVDYDNLGQPGSLAGIGHEWASVSAAPFNLFKFSAAEGGVRVPLLVSGPGIRDLGLTDARAHVVDIAPTVAEIAGVAYAPDEIDGRSLMPLLSGAVDSVYGETDEFAIEVSGAAALYRGDLKITRTPAPYGDGGWHLYDVAVDPGETTDLADKYPDLFDDLIAAYEAYARDVGVFELPDGEDARGRIVVNSTKKFAENYWQLIVAAVAALLLLVYGFFRGSRQLLGR